MNEALTCYTTRRFGIELEVNTPSGVVNKKLEKKQTPEGAEEVAGVLFKKIKKPIQIIGWDFVHNNRLWIVKPDSSCGIEINSPVLKGRIGINEACAVADALKQDYNKVDQRCGLHVHVDVSDLTVEQVAKVLIYYIKAEHLFFDAVPSHRKNNRYCQLIGMSDLFSHDSVPLMTPQELISRMAEVKYYSCNVYHLMQGGGFIEKNDRKKTIEFRIAEEKACVDSFILKNWLRLLLYFVDCAKDLLMPRHYKSDDQLTGLAWIDLSVFIKLLRLDCELDDDLQEMKSWFLDRMVQFGYDPKLSGVWSNDARKFARQELMEYYSS